MRERVCVYVCVSERERESVCVCVCVCVRERVCLCVLRGVAMEWGLQCMVVLVVEWGEGWGHQRRDIGHYHPVCVKNTDD